MMDVRMFREIPKLGVTPWAMCYELAEGAKLFY